MSHDLTEPTLGYIVTPITWDGTNFHPLLSTVAGLLQVSVEAATEIVTHCMGLDGAAWVGIHVDAQGDVQTDVLTIADGEIRCYGWTGAAWARLKVTGAGLVQNEVQTIVEGQIRVYGYDGGGWVRLLTDAAGHTQADVLTIADGEIRNYGWTGGAWVKLSVDAAGHTQADVVTIVDGQIRGYLWTGAAWAKVKGLASGIAQVDIDSLRGHADVIPLHYHGQWRKRFSRVVDAGQDYVDSTAVPAGMVAVVTNISIFTNNAGTTVVIAAARDGVDTTFICRDGAPAASVPYIWTGELWLDAGDYIRADPTGCPIGGIVYLDINAYHMRIA